jgi:hypothetical protein
MPVELLRILFGYSFFSCFIASVVGSFALYAHFARDTHCGNPLRLQHRSNRSRSGAISPPGRTISSLPNMIVIMRVIGAKNGGVFIGLIVLISTFVGMLNGAIVGISIR